MCAAATGICSGLDAKRRAVAGGTNCKGNDEQDSDGLDGDDDHGRHQQAEDQARAPGCMSERHQCRAAELEEGGDVLGPDADAADAIVGQSGEAGSGCGRRARETR